MTEAPLHFVEQIRNALIETQTIPVSGFPPEFPWEALCEKIGTLLHAADTKITPRKTELLPPDAFASGLGANPLMLAIELTPLSGQVFWLIGKEDMAKLSAVALFNSNGGKGFSSSKFQEGFYYFLATQALAIIDALNAFKGLSLKLGKFSSLPQEEALCIDVEVQHPKATFWGRLVCPTSFHQSFKSHFSMLPPPPLTGDLVEQIEVSLRLQIGQTSMPLSRWKEVAVGDFILLDRCTFDPETLKGTVMLLLENTPLLRARIKDNSVKILDYAFYHEEQNPMNPEMPEQEESLEEPFDEPEDLSSQYESEQGNNTSHLWASQNGQNGGEEQTVSSGEPPLLFSIEVARLRINLGRLLELKGGSILEQPVQPELGVDVILGDKMIAKAELIKLGEMIGVKILQLGER